MRIMHCGEIKASYLGDNRKHIHLKQGAQGNRMEIGWLRMRDAPNKRARLHCLFYGWELLI
jgi:hypothetical protein